MKHLIHLLLTSLLFTGTGWSADWQLQSLPGKPSLRGSAVSHDVAWVTGTNNSVFISTDGGQTWQDRSVKHDLVTDFRDIAVFDAETAIVMGVGNGSQSRLYLTEDQGMSWQLLHDNPDETGFFDSIGFWDRQNGLLLGDPVDGYYVIKRTVDGGKTWQRVEKHNLPAMLDNEAAFAASGNTLIVGKDGLAYFTTGGFEASVYISENYGALWQRFRVPLHKVNQTSGGYGLAINAKGQPFVIGGDYQQRDGHYANMATRIEQQWQTVALPQPGLRTAMSCFNHTCITTGKRFTDWSTDHGASWQPLLIDGQAQGFYTLAQDKGLFIAAGHDGRIGVWQSN